MGIQRAKFGRGGSSEEVRKDEYVISLLKEWKLLLLIRQYVEITRMERGILCLL